MLNSTATKILFEHRGGKKVATGVEFIYNGKIHFARASKEVIVAGGAVNSPQILLLSGVGPKSDLDRVGIQQVHELPGVGRNLHNHVTFYLTYLLKKKQSFTDLDWANALEYILNRKGPMSSTGMSQVTARVNTKYADPSGNHPDLQIFFAGYLANCAKSGEVRSLDDPEKPHAPKHFTLSPVVLHPKSRGYITLKSKDPLAPPLIYANYLTEPEDVATLVEGIRVIQRLANSSTLQNKYGMVIDKEEYGDCIRAFAYDSDDFWRCAVVHSTGPENHQVGSCKMGPSSDRMTVVDKKLKVCGLENVRVMDASIIPTIVSGNTHASVVMIAERGVDFIKEKWLGTRLENRFGEEKPTVRPNKPSTSSGHPHPSHNFPQKPVVPSQPGVFPKPQGYPQNPVVGISPPTGGYNYGSNKPDFHHNPDFHRKHPHMPNPFENSENTNNRGSREFTHGQHNPGLNTGNENYGNRPNYDSNAGQNYRGFVWRDPHENQGYQRS